MNDTSPALARLNALVSDVVDLRHAATLIGWDERVYMPPGGVPVHGDMAATIQRIDSERAPVRMIRRNACAHVSSWFAQICTTRSP